MQEKLILKKFIIEEIAGNNNFEEWNDDDSLLAKGVIDSVNILQILAFIEEHFKIKLTDEELIPENFESINSLSILVYQKLSSGSTKCGVASDGA